MSQALPARDLDVLPKPAQARADPAAPTQRPERIDALDGLRGLMAWAVAAYHFAVLSRAFEPQGLVNSALAVLGLQSVEAFFMISGFCLYHRHATLRPTGHAVATFYRQRFVRIAPVFYLTLALNAVLQQAVSSDPGWLQWLENLTFTFGLQHPNRALVTGGWSIGLECLFYLGFPWLVVASRSLALLLAGLAASTWLAWSYSASAVVGSDTQRFAAYVLPQNHAFAFLLGMLLARLRAHTSARVPLGLALCVLGAGLTCWLASGPRIVDHFEVVLGASRAGYVAVGCGIVGLFGLAHTPSARAQRWLGALGELSYPIYLLHPLAWLFASAWLPSWAGRGLAFAGALVTTLALGWWVRRYYEQPLQRRFARQAGLVRPGAEHKQALGALGRRMTAAITQTARAKFLP